MNSERMQGSHRQEDRCDEAHDAAGRHAIERDLRGAPAKITLLYESKDGRLCLFEDFGGHLSAVRASRLA